MNKIIVAVALAAAVFSLSPCRAADSASLVADGSLIKSDDFQAVYYFAGGERYVFPDEKTFYSWYDDFSGVITVPSSQLAQIPLGGNVTYRPGKYLVKVQTDPKVYAVERGGVLRWVQTEQAARDLYGANWRYSVHDVPDEFFSDYTVDAARPLTCSCGFMPAAITAGTTTIAEDKGVVGE